MTSTDLSAAELLSTTRAFRRRLDFTQQVSRADVLDSLDIAVHAPSGSNRQPWRFVAIDDPQTRAAVAEYYRKGFAANVAGRTPQPDQLADLTSAQHLAEHIHQAPVLVLVCAAARLPAGAPPPMLASFYGSVYPMVWNFMLALRLRGLGACLTTAHLRYEAEVAGLLSIPLAEVTQVALLPVGALRPGKLTPPVRQPAATLTGWNRWEGE